MTLRGLNCPTAPHFTADGGVNTWHRAVHSSQHLHVMYFIDVSPLTFCTCSTHERTHSQECTHTHKRTHTQTHKRTHTHKHTHKCTHSHDLTVTSTRSGGGWRWTVIILSRGPPQCSGGRGAVCHVGSNTRYQGPSLIYTHIKYISRPTLMTRWVIRPQGETSRD